MSLKKPNRTKQPIWRSPWLWGLLVLVLAGGTGSWFYWSKTAQAQSSAAAAAQVTHTEAVTNGSLQVSASGSGVLQAGQSLDLSFSTRGTVAVLNVQIGDTVKAGQVLASLEKPADLEAEVASAELTLLQAQNSITAMQSNAAVNLAKAYQTLLSAQKTYTTAQAAELRTANTRCSKEVLARTKETYERALTTLDDLTARDYGSDAWTNAKNGFATAEANFTYCTAYTSAEKADAGSTSTVAKSALTQAETSYATLKAAAGIDPAALALAQVNLKEAETRLAAAQEKLSGITLTAPLDGKIIYLAASKGTIVDTAKFTTIASLSTMKIQITVDEADLDKLVAGAAAEVVFDALPEQTFSGTVTQVDPALTTSGQYRVAKGTVTLAAEAVQALQNVPLGLSATVNVVSKEAKDVLLVPVAALKDNGDQGYAVLLKGSDGQMTLTPIQIGIQDSTHAEVISGLKLGDQVSTGIITTASSNSSTQNGGDGMMPPPDGGAPPAQ